MNSYGNQNQINVPSSSIITKIRGKRCALPSISDNQQLPHRNKKITSTYTISMQCFNPFIVAPKAQNSN